MNVQNASGADPGFSFGEGGRGGGGGVQKIMCAYAHHERGARRRYKIYGRDPGLA